MDPGELPNIDAAGSAAPAVQVAPGIRPEKPADDSDDSRPLLKRAKASPELVLDLEKQIKFVGAFLVASDGGDMADSSHAVSARAVLQDAEAAVRSSAAGPGVRGGEGDGGGWGFRGPGTGPMRYNLVF